MTVGFFIVSSVIGYAIVCCREIIDHLRRDEIEIEKLSIEMGIDWDF